MDLCGGFCCSYYGSPFPNDTMLTAEGTVPKFLQELMERHRLLLVVSVVVYTRSSFCCIMADITACWDLVIQAAGHLSIEMCIHRLSQAVYTRCRGKEVVTALISREDGFKNLASLMVTLRARVYDPYESMDTIMDQVQVCKPGFSLPMCAQALPF